MRLLILLACLARRLGRTGARTYLAARFWLLLNYPWRLAWIKAERS